jgi:crossover junction endonuclease MUS81
VNNVIYLVEEYSISAERSERYGDSLESAIASMQMVNGFFVKQTSKLDETVRYLACMTKSLKERYEKRDLRVVPTAALEGRTLQSLSDELNDKQPYANKHVTFLTFSKMSDKSDALTLRDVYLKMLMCVRGVTGEKAIEIQKRWPTPNALIEAYAAMRSEEAKKHMVSEQLGTLIPRKKIAKGLSAKIADVWA